MRNKITDKIVMSKMTVEELLFLSFDIQIALDAIDVELNNRADKFMEDEADG